MEAKKKKTAHNPYLHTYTKTFTKIEDTPKEEPSLKVSFSLDVRA
jgi:hypothetical protein